jgi:excisionase family DNA binding protein
MMQWWADKLDALREGATVTPAEGCMKDDLAIEEAADFLNVSRSYLLNLIESGAFPIHLVGLERRVRRDDLARYKEQVDAQRRKALDELTVEAQKLRLGY